jgi:cobalt-precorrin-5B (C1)-methyltransferase
VKEICEKFNYDGGLDILIEVPQGEQIAKRTYNERLGIIGGISILGTGGIVEPMSEQALIDSIKTELRMLSAIGYQSLLVSPGNYSTYFAKNNLKIDVENSVKCSNFVGETLDACVELGFERILMLGHVANL